ACFVPLRPSSSASSSVTSSTYVPLRASVKSIVTRAALPSWISSPLRSLTNTVLLAIGYAPFLVVQDASLLGRVRISASPQVSVVPAALEEVAGRTLRDGIGGQRDLPSAEVVSEVPLNGSGVGTHVRIFALTSRDA